MSNGFGNSQVIYIHKEDVDYKVKLSSNIKNVHKLPVPSSSIPIVVFILYNVIGNSIVSKCQNLHESNSVPIYIKVLLVFKPMVLHQLLWQQPAVGGERS